MGIKIIKSLKHIKKDNLPLVIGYFGCIHVMHQQLLNKYHHFNVLTFTDLISKKQHQIYNYKTRLENIKKFNPKNIYVLDINSHNMTGMQFINKILKQIQPSEILVGEDFKFGSDGLGIKVLQHYFKVSALRYNPNISTQKIYELLSKGEIEKANDYMAFYLYFKGKWVGGDKRGRKIGYPTINLINERPFILPEGAYATYITIGNKKYKSVTFVGNSLLAKRKQSKVETYVINQKIKNRLLYPFWVKNNVIIEFFRFIRPSKKLTSLDSLKNTISKDVNLANKYFSEEEFK